MALHIQAVASKIWGDGSAEERAERVGEEREHCHFGALHEWERYFAALRV